jgi:NADPH-dependent 2,4-dienoyl-CoA reductase/sulfur reductase-like enzyme
LVNHPLIGKKIREPAREINVCRETDVVVVGGGPGGFGAALAAARNGADTVLIERYGHLGGMSSGGLVTIIPNMTGFDGKQYINGICGEWVDKLESKEATGYPKVRKIKRESATG